MLVVLHLQADDPPRDIGGQRHHIGTHPCIPGPGRPCVMLPGEPAEQHGQPHNDQRHQLRNDFVYSHEAPISKITTEHTQA
ncbi:hypothetical protein D3C71_1992960 [compost metagenome]